MTNAVKKGPSAQISSESNSSSARHTERHYTIEEVAEMWGLSKDSVRKMFRNEPDVIVIRGGVKKAHGLIRIPASVLERVHRRMTNE